MLRFECLYFKLKMFVNSYLKFFLLSLIKNIAYISNYQEIINRKSGSNNSLWPSFAVPQLSYPKTAQSYEASAQGICAIVRSECAMDLRTRTERVRNGHAHSYKTSAQGTSAFVQSELFHPDTQL